MSNKFKTFAVAKCELLEPTKERVGRAQAAVAEMQKEETVAANTSQKDLLKFALENKQEDLQYFKAVYATCGFNLNDDVFVNEEFWDARKSPVLKPTNWQHKDKDIIGVIYAVEAQYLDGTPIDIEKDVVPKDDFELIVYGVVYKYTFAEFADEIEKRSKAGELFVSMETWFSDFTYALLDKDSQKMKIVARNDKTIGLDKYLKCFGGVGQYNGQRIGRVLKGMTFGGMGIVDRPANPGSRGLVQASGNENMETLKMVESAEVRTAVKAELEERAKAEKAVALEAEVATLKKDNATAAENLQRAAERAERAEEAKKLADAILAKLGKSLEDAVAGVGTTPPPEIAKIDSAKTADEKFAAMIAFLGQTGKALSGSEAGLKKEVETLKTKVAEFEAAKAAADKTARTNTRKAELKTILGDGSDETVEKLIKNFADLDDVAYAARLEEVKLVASKSAPTVDHTGGAGKPDAEGKSGESKAGSGPREDRKINVAAALENAAVEQAIEPKSGDNKGSENPFKGLAELIFKKKEE